MQKTKILYVEDDLLTAENLILFLQDDGFSVTHVETITDAIALMKNYSFDLVILDLMLQDYSGFEFLKSLKKLGHIPVIVISAISEIQTKIKAFRYGASDYMVKPIDLLELEARIWAVLGRHSEITLDGQKEQLYIEDGEVYFNNQVLHLTPIEYEIIEVLIKNKNKTVTRESILEEISSIGSARSLDYHIKNIREKLQDDTKLLKTVYGVGYKLILHKAK